MKNYSFFALFTRSKERAGPAQCRPGESTPHAYTPCTPCNLQPRDSPRPDSYRDSLADPLNRGR